MNIHPASRKSIRPLICFYAESGCGKTFSALLLARGFAGPAGKIVMADSEAGRGELYADVIAGGYDVLSIEEPFSPAKYADAICQIEDAGAAVGIIDSGSHEWEGVGGVLDLAGGNEEKSGKPGLHNWRKPKMEHALFIQKLLRAKIPLIVCLRAKFKSRQTKDSNGKTVIVKDDHVTPIQSEEFIFECTAHAEILPDHSIRLTKCSHPTLGECFPKTGPITEDTGRKIAVWCMGAKLKTKHDHPAKVETWKLLSPRHGGDVSKFRQFLVDETILDPELPLAEVPDSMWPKILEKAKARV